MQRQKVYSDPVIRSCIFLEKFLTIADVLKGVLMSDYEDVPLELCGRIDCLLCDMNENIMTLVDLLQQPRQSQYRRCDEGRCEERSCDERRSN